MRMTRIMLISPSPQPSPLKGEGAVVRFPLLLGEGGGEVVIRKFA